MVLALLRIAIPPDVPENATLASNARSAVVALL
jgi:hypothetical protein